MNTTETTIDRNAALAELGFALTSSAPVGAIDTEWSTQDKPWPHIAYSVTLTFNGRLVLSTPYRLGVGHVDPKKARPDSIAEQWTTEESILLHAWQSKPHVDFKDKALQAQVAGRLARKQKVSPTLADVIYSLLSDGEAFLQAMSFEEWAQNFDYDVDSRKAESIYETCMETGRQLSRTVPADVLAKVREIMDGY